MKLDVRFEPHLDDKRFWTIFHMVAALIKMDAPELCMSCYRLMAFAGVDKIKDLIFLAKEARVNGKPDMSTEILSTLKECHPRNFEALLN